MGERAHLTLVHATRCACFPWRLGWMHNVPALRGGSNTCTLQVHPDDAARLGLSDGMDAMPRARWPLSDLTAAP